MGNRSLKEAIIKIGKEGRKVPVIGEIKVYSPTEGDLLRGRDPLSLAKEMVECGVAGISVVTEPKYFYGDINILKSITRTFSLPLFRKDFIFTASQIEESKEAGASAVLLIVSKIPLSLLKELHQLSHQLGIETVIEVHKEEEIEKVSDLDLDIIGINNRDILQLEKDKGDISVTERLAPFIPKGTIILSESGIKNPEDVRRVIKAGANAVLIGTAILQAENLKEKLLSLTYPYKPI